GLAARRRGAGRERDEPAGPRRAHAGGGDRARHLRGDGIGADRLGDAARRKSSRRPGAGRGRSAGRLLAPGGGEMSAPVAGAPPRVPRLGGGFWGGLLLGLYLTAILAPWIALYPPNRQHRDAPNAPPMRLHLNAPSRWGSESVLYVHPQRLVDSLRRRY